MEGKKGLQLIPLFFLMLLLTVALLGAAVLCFNAASGKGGTLLRVDVAIAGGDEDEMTEKAVKLVQRMDVIKSIAKFHRVSEAEADKKISDGTYDAAIYLTDNMYEDINEGYNTPIVIKISDNPTLSAALFRELVLTGVEDLQTAESTIYSVYDMSKEYPTKKRTRKVANKMASRFINLFLGRGTTFKTTMLSAYGDMTALEFAEISLVLVFALILGIGFAPFYGRDEIVTGRSLARIGVGRVYQSGVKIVVMTGILWVFLIILTALLKIPEMLREVSLLRPVHLLLPALGIAAYIHFIYQLLPGESGSFLYMIVTVMMVVLAGGLFPVSLMPPALAQLSGVLPFYGWQSYLSGMTGESGVAHAGILILITACLLIALAEGAAYVKERTGER